MEKKTEVLLRLREFFADDSLDCVMVSLERDDYGEEGKPDVYFSGGIFLSEQGLGHFCFESGDLEELAAAAGKIAEQAMRLRNACLAARPEPAREDA